MAWTVRLMRLVEHRAWWRMPGEGVFPGGSEAGVDTVEPFVVLGEFVVAVVRGADGGGGALVGVVGQDEDLTGEAGLDDAVGPGRGEIVGAAG